MAAANYTFWRCELATRRRNAQLVRRRAQDAPPAGRDQEMQAYAEHAEAAANGAPQLPPVNDKNGGETSWGSWEQTKPEVTAFVKLPPGVKPRDCNV
eukprot:2965740-Prymnesium_polylepis.1